MNKDKRIVLAKQSLRGISIGDAFGESFFGETKSILQHIQDRTIPETTWEFTDDTVMAIAVFEQLEKESLIQQDDLIKQFIINHNLDPIRGYGATARRILREVEEGGDWGIVAKSVFDGMGSMGNGAAMRVAPIGAYHFDDFEKIKKLASESAEVTHANIEAIAGAIAIAIGTAITTQSKLEGNFLTPQEFISSILKELPDTDTKSKINKSLSIPLHFHLETIKSVLGNGIKMMSQDTVPFCIWCAAHHQNNFEEALWKGVSVLGDRDTICAIIGGMVIMSADENSIPIGWQNHVENFEESAFRSK